MSLSSFFAREQWPLFFRSLKIDESCWMVMVNPRKMQEYEGIFMTTQGSFSYFTRQNTMTAFLR